MNPGWFHHSTMRKQNRIVRISLGILFIIGGVLGWLPILGFWMVPIGLVILSIDFAIARRWRRRLEVWWGRRIKPKVDAWLKKHRKDKK